MRKCHYRIRESIRGIILERGVITVQCNFKVCLEVSCSHTSQPSSADVRICLTLGRDELRQTDIYLQSVRLDTLDLHQVGEHRTSYMKFSAPSPGLSIFICPGAERIESTCAFSHSLSVIEDTVRGKQFHGHGMTCRNRAILIFNNQSEIDIISRPPYSPFSIYISFQSSDIGLAGNIKETCRLLMAVRNLQIAGRDSI